MDDAPGDAGPSDVGLLATALAAGGVCSAVEAMKMLYDEALLMNVRLAYRYEQERQALEKTLD
ncbi:MAG: hypothetical protein LCH53_06180 [Bacteroidetes bacterium]|nr:hypothetical protein [Bacteroidota bacterium]